jgi:hypothetical protein
MTTLPSRFAHQRRTMPHPRREASQVMTTKWAEPVSPARKASCNVLPGVCAESMLSTAGEKAVGEAGPCAVASEVNCEVLVRHGQQSRRQLLG